MRLMGMQMGYVMFIAYLILWKPELIAKTFFKFAIALCLIDVVLLMLNSPIFIIAGAIIAIVLVIKGEL